MAEASNREQIEQAHRTWSAEMLQPAEAKASAKTFETLSELPIAPLATPLDYSEAQYVEQVGFPGQQPFTRGVQPTMYRGRLWDDADFRRFRHG